MASDALEVQGSIPCEDSWQKNQTNHIQPRDMTVSPQMTSWVKLSDTHPKTITPYTALRAVQVGAAVRHPTKVTVTSPLP